MYASRIVGLSRTKVHFVWSITSCAESYVLCIRETVTFITYC